MKRTPVWRRILAAVITVAAALFTAGSLFAQVRPNTGDDQEANVAAEHQQKLQQVLADKTAYADSIVRRWEGAARASGRWDDNYASDMQRALLKLRPEKLLMIGEAPSLEDVMHVLATGHLMSKAPSDPSAQAPEPEMLGDLGDDLVFTPVTPCRIVDTRYAAAGAILAGQTRYFDMDGSNFSTQGGYSGSCGIPYGVARAVAMTITVAGPGGPGHFRLWGGGSMPNSSVLNYMAGDTLANTTVTPVVPGVGNDFSLYSVATAHAIIDVVGYYAAPVATPLECTTASTSASAPVGQWTSIVATCPSGATPTGGGFDFTVADQSLVCTSQPYSSTGWRTWVWNPPSNVARTVYTYVRCCHVPGR